MVLLCVYVHKYDGMRIGNRRCCAYGREEAYTQHCMAWLSHPRGTQGDAGCPLEKRMRQTHYGKRESRGRKTFCTATSPRGEVPSINHHHYILHTMRLGETKVLRMERGDRVSAKIEEKIKHGGMLRMRNPTYNA